MGTSAVMNERRKSTITVITSASEILSAIRTSRIDDEIKSASSEPTMISMPSGRVFAMRSISERTRLEISIVLAWLWRSTDIPTAGWPLARTIRLSSSTPRSTSATSSRRTG